MLRAFDEHLHLRVRLYQREDRRDDDERRGSADRARIDLCDVRESDSRVQTGEGSAVRPMRQVTDNFNSDPLPEEGRSCITPPEPLLLPNCGLRPKLHLLHGVYLV